jgi:hypothetical protein
VVLNFSLVDKDLPDRVRVDSEVSQDVVCNAFGLENCQENVLCSDFQIAEGRGLNHKASATSGFSRFDHVAQVKTVTGMLAILPPAT